jgi:hypothetical protein
MAGFEVIIYGRFWVIAKESGLTARNTDALALHHLQLNADQGSAFVIDSASNLELDDLTTHKPIPSTPVLRLTKSPGATLR